MASVKLNINIKDETQEDNRNTNENSSKNIDNNKDNTNNDNTNSDNIQLKLGDIIEITAPEISDFDKKTFFIKFLNSQKIVLKNIETLETKIINI